MRVTIGDLRTGITVSELFAELKPPKEFAPANFSNFFPDPNFDSQSDALEKARTFAESLGKKNADELGVYLDGGFGVGKTHILASIYHEAKTTKLFGPFIAYTSIIGYLGFAEAVTQFSKYKLLCIDEFELDDPGDTMIMSRFLKELSAKGVRFATTSNTPPAALGEGRFAADNFQREIQSVASKFVICRIDGEDYRHRKAEYDFRQIDDSRFQELVDSSERVLVSNFSELLAFLSTIHQSKYAKVAEQIDSIVIEDVYQIDNQFEGLRFVSLIDRCYEAGIRVHFTGLLLSSVFREDHVQGAYRKKYLRSLSRLSAMQG
jgi:cell division protein ZapE